jgi:hypothetical protein
MKWIMKQEIGKLLFSFNNQSSIINHSDVFIQLEK